MNLKNLLTLFIIPLMSLSLLAEDYQAGHRLIDTINKLEKRGELSPAKALAYKAYAVLDRDLLPEQILQNNYQPLKCGTPIIREIQEKWEILLPEDQERIHYLLNRSILEDRETYVSPSGHYNLHYTTTGTDAVPSADYNSNGIPDYVENFALYFDTVWQTEIIDLGYNAPNLGSNNMQEVYIENLNGVYGYVSGFDNLHVDNDYAGFPPNDDPEGSQAGAMKVTAAHEFHHEIQYTYQLSSSWYMEATSTFMEDVVFDVVNDYYWYLSRWFSNPWISLTTFENNDVHQYSACIWNHYLSESFGVDIVREIWSYPATNAITCFINVLNDYNTNLEDEFQEFETWNYFTGSRANYGHDTYQEASNYPLASIQGSHYFYSSTEGYSDQSVSSSKYPQKLSCNYLRFVNYNQQSQGILLVTIQGDAGTTWGGYALTDSTSNHYVSQYPIIYENGHDGVVIIPSWSELNSVIVVPTVIATSGGSAGYPYTYSAEVVNSVVYLTDFQVAEVSGNGNGSLESDETGSLVVFLRNYGNDLSGVTLTITTNSSDINITNGNYDVGSFPHNSEINNSSNPFTFQLGPDVQPQQVEITLHVYSNSDEITTESIHFNIGFAPILFVDDDNGTDENDVVTASLDSLGVIYEVRDVSTSGLENLFFTQRQRVIWSSGEQDNAFSTAEKDSLRKVFLSETDLLIIGQNLGEQLSDLDWLPIQHQQYSATGWLKGVNDDLLGVTDQNWLWILAPIDGNEQISTNGDPRAFISFSYVGTDLGGVVRFREHGRTVIADFPFTSITQQTNDFLDADDFLQVIFDYFQNDNRLPDSFSLQSPANDSTVIFESIEQTLTFSWNASNDNETLNYTLFFFTDSSYSSEQIYEINAGTQTSITLNTGQLQELLETYDDSLNLYWGVVASDGKEPRVASSLNHLTLLLNLPNTPPTIPTPLSPGNNDTLQILALDNHFTFSWDRSIDPEGNEISYLLQIDEEPFSEPFFTTFTLSDTFLTLPADTLLAWLGMTEGYRSFWWSVTATDGELSVNSDTLKFTIEKTVNIPPYDCAIISPLDGEEFTLDSIQDSISVDWNPARDFEGDTLIYTLFIDSPQGNLLYHFSTPDTHHVLHGETIFSFFPEGEDTLFTSWYIQFTDGTNQVNSDTILITLVEGINEPPESFSILTPIDGDTLFLYPEQDSSFLFTWNSSQDPDNDPLVYHFYLLEGNATTDSSFLYHQALTDTVLYLPADTLYHFLGGDTSRTFTWLVKATDGEFWITTDPVNILLIDQALTSIQPPSTTPLTFTLFNNYPNPFNPETSIRFQIPEPAMVEINIYNILGKKVRTLIRANLQAGEYTLKWDSRDDNGQPLPTGIYFYQLKANHFSAIKKMILVK